MTKLFVLPFLFTQICLMGNLAFSGTKATVNTYYLRPATTVSPP